MRVLVLGLDGATFDLIRPWAREGKLPTFKKLMDGGAWSELRSTVPPVTASAWSSFMTGKNPGAHGLFDFMQRRAGTYELAPVSALDRDGKSLWELAGEAGKRVIVMNVPVTYPPQPVNGLLITGMLTPRGAPNYTYPPELAIEIGDHIGEYVIYSDEVYSKGRGESFLRALEYSAEQRTRAAEYLMGKYPWELFVLVFPETDTVSHGLWSSFDVSHHEHDAVEAEKMRPGILRIYSHIDSLLARLLTQGGDDTTIMLMSDHGHGPVRRFFYVNNFLAQCGLLQFKTGFSSQAKRLAFRLGVTPRRVYGMLLALGMGKLRRTLDKRRSGRSLLKRFFLSFADVDWARTRAYSIGYIGEVHINLRGREPRGIVEPGKDYEETRDKLIANLRSLKLPDGTHLVEHIWKKEEIYAGAHLADAPDVLFLPRNLETIAFGDFEFGSNRILEPSFGVSSSHRMNGILIAAGTGVRNIGEFSGAELIDLAPTTLHLLGVPVPTDMDGRVLAELMADSRAIDYGGTSEGQSSAEGGYSQEEEAQIMERLQDLGYIS